MKKFVYLTAFLVIIVLLNYVARKRSPFAYADLADYPRLYATKNNNAGPTRPVEAWAVNRWLDDKRVPMAKIRQMLKDSVGMGEQDSEVAKIIKISRYILQRTQKYLGTPTDAFNALHPVEQLQAVQEGRSPVWCGNLEAMFSCLATAAEIPARLVSAGEIKNGAVAERHVFSEVYLQENKCWSYVDLTTNVILPEKENKYLNVVDIQRLLADVPGDNAVKAYCFSNDTMLVAPFNEWRSLPAFYFTPHTVFSFYYDYYFRMYPADNYSKRIGNFFSAQPYYAQYALWVKPPAYSFYGRIASNYLLLLAALAWAGCLVFILYIRIRA
jgi:hypothetical protein